MEKENNSSHVEVENFMLETNFGIIPKDLWRFSKSENKDPFAGYSAEKARKVKRKFRKLKRRLNIDSEDSAKHLWNTVDGFLRRLEKI